MTWSEDIHQALRDFEVRQVAYVPDGGLTELLNLIAADSSMRPVLLTSEQEGIGVVTGAWLGGQRAVLLMQSSGVGNCINLLSLMQLCRPPFLTIVTMRGEWGEFNPWQVPMGSTTAAALALMGVHAQRAETAEAVGPTVRAAARMAFEGGSQMAVLLSQRLIGTKEFDK